MKEYTLPIIDKHSLEELYFEQRLSSNEIAAHFNCSSNRINYWMRKYGLQKRSIGEAVYIRANPSGDPFKIRHIETLKDAELLGLGIGLYWGEGTKANKHSVRLGNTDPALLKSFIHFLERLFGVRREDLHFGLQIFTDIDPKQAIVYWTKTLGVKPSQFYKVHVTITGSIGTYRKKNEYGVVTIYYNNKKLRDLLVDMLPR